jgi:hypothetical protein
MAYQKVHIKIDKKTGKLFIEGDGFVGQQCDVLSDIEAQLGTVVKSEDKAEKFQYVQPDYVPQRLG